MMNRRDVLKVSPLTSGAVLASPKSNHAKAANQAVNHPTGGVFDPPSPKVIRPYSVKETVKVKFDVAGDQ